MDTSQLFAHAALLALLACSAGGCAVNPATGETQLSLISTSQEIQIGRQSAEQIQQTMAMVDDRPLQDYVSDLGQELAAASERPDLPWSFSVVDDPAPNAFALPGGFIYVTRGMITLMNNEAELVSVLGHEIAHVTARHSVAQLSRAQLAQLGMGLGMILVPELRPFGDLAGMGVNLLMLKYSREAERQADELGFAYAREQNYDVREMADVFESLGRMSQLGGDSALPSWFATHPAPAERVAAVEERLEGVISRDPAARVGRSAYMNHIDGLAFGDNPRNGFFRDGTFYHPELAFQVTVPPEWQTRNLAQAVLAQSPEGDAAMQLTSSGADEPAAGLRQFLGQPGVRAGRASQGHINGLPAVTAPFQAQTQQAQVAGYVTYVEHQEHVYQIVSYAAPRSLGQRRAQLEAVADSFAPLTDQDILAVEPPVVDVVEVDEAMTLAEFQRRYPSPISMERLAIINQLEGSQSPIEAGTRLKRVVGDPELFEQSGVAQAD